MRHSRYQGTQCYHFGGLHELFLLNFCKSSRRYIGEDADAVPNTVNKHHCEMYVRIEGTSIFSETWHIRYQLSATFLYDL